MTSCPGDFKVQMFLDLVKTVMFKANIRSPRFKSEIYYVKKLRFS